MPQPYAYIRRSKVRANSPGVVSYATQRKAIEAMVPDGAQPVWLEDWGKSGGSTKGRDGYKELMEAITDGQVSILYSYNLTRLGRSVPDLLALVELCASNSVPVKLADGMQVDASNAIGKMVLTVLAAVAAMQRELTSEAAYATAAVRRARGDVMGRKPYGDEPGDDLQAVKDAFEKAGSFLGAAKLLNAAKVKSRLGRAWSSQVIGDIVKTNWPERVPLGSVRGRRTVSKHLLTGLLTCPGCGKTMSTMADAYYCRAAQQDATHPRPYYVAESKLIGWVKETAAKAGPVLQIDQSDGDDQSAQAALQLRRERLGDLYLDSRFDKARLDRLMAAVDVELAATTASSRAVKAVVAKDRIDWSDPGKANGALRELWSEVRLGPDLLPITAEWRWEALADAAERQAVNLESLMVRDATTILHQLEGAPTSTA